MRCMIIRFYFTSRLFPSSPLRRGGATDICNRLCCATTFLRESACSLVYNQERLRGQAFARFCGRRYAHSAKNVCNTFYFTNPVTYPLFQKRKEGKADILNERPVGGANRRRLERKFNKGNTFDAISDAWRSGRARKHYSTQYIVRKCFALAPRLPPKRSLSKLTLSRFLCALLFPLFQRAGWRVRARRQTQARRR